jgi:glycosyltransferase involved in cell wall biosynthesis
MASPSSGTPRVSIITPVWNRAALITETIASALTQTFRDFELIVADDGSTDASVARVLAFEDPRLIVLRLPHSGRPAVARNAAMRVARGEYIAYLDSDDVWLPGKLAEQVQCFDQRPDAGMLYGLAGYKSGRGIRGPKIARVPESIFELLLLHGNFIPTSSVLIRREVCEALGGFDEAPQHRAVEDLDLWLRVAHSYPCLFMPRVVTQYRVHAGNLSADQRAMVPKVRSVIAANCQRFAVSQALCDRAMAAWYVEALKAELAEGDSEHAAREAITRALAIDPGLRSARWADRLFKLGLYRPVRLAYRNRKHLTGVRAAFYRRFWTRSPPL